MCDVRATGQVHCWGNNSNGQLGTGSYDCTGGAAPNSFYDCVAPGGPAVGLSDVVQITGGYVHSYALGRSGQVYGFGWLPWPGMVPYDDFLSPTAITALSDISQVSSNNIADQTSCALRRDGQVVCWGYSGEGGLPQDSPLPAVLGITLPSS
jgi:alpha-tubulin suppressor-like RCC1 family protein